jgi:hypothetical protein
MGFKHGFGSNLSTMCYNFSLDMVLILEGFNPTKWFKTSCSRYYTVCPGSVRTVFIKNTRHELF